MLHKKKIFSEALARHAQASYENWKMYPCNIPSCTYYPSYKTSLKGIALYAIFNKLIFLKQMCAQKYYKNLAYVQKIKHCTNECVSVQLRGRFRVARYCNEISERYIFKTKYLLDVSISTVLDAYEEHDIQEIRFGSCTHEEIYGRNDIVYAYFYENCPIHSKKNIPVCLIIPAPNFN